MDQKSDKTQDTIDPEQEKLNSQLFLSALREKSSIQVTRGNSISFTDYVSSLGLDANLFDIQEKKKLSLEDYVHFFEVERKTEIIENNPLKWTIRRRSTDFFKFEQKLNEELISEAKLAKSDLPRLSSLFHQKEEARPEGFAEAAETYLKQLLESPEIRSKSKALYEFLEISLLPLPIAPKKFKEGYLKKKGGGRYKRNKAKLYLSFLFAKCQERWFILTQDGILYAVDSSSTKTREMLFFDQTFQIEYGRKATGHHNGISIVTPNRRLNLLAEDVFEAVDWIGDIQKAAQASPYTKLHRFKSFAPERENIHDCKWFVDAEGYYEALYEALINAKREVFITDWMFSPEIALKRPVQDDESEYRLDRVLAKIANSGIKVYVIVYREVRMLMYNDSEHVRRSLESLSPNIIVLKHPSEPLFHWSHHEKMVVIDQTVGFIGGLDLTFGRWDTSDHPLYDPAFDQGKGVTYFGQDFANPRVANWKNVRELPHVTLIDKKTTPRMPFHDAMVRVVGPAVADMSRHFIQFWNHVEVDSYNKGPDAPLPKHGIAPALDEASFSKEKIFTNLATTLKSLEAKDLAHKASDLLTRKDSSQRNQPSLVMSASVSSEGLASNEKEKNIAEDCDNLSASGLEKREDVNQKVTSLDQIEKNNESGIIQKTFYNIRDKVLSIVNNFRGSKEGLDKEIVEQISKREILQLLLMSEKQPQEGTIACQMLRSASKWSLGLNAQENVMENSILTAFVETIQNAKHFVYMESQFFISGTAGPNVKNEVSEALLYRIEKAHARQEKFRVLIFIPLIHAFEGDIVDAKSVLIRIQLHWQYMTMSRGGHSIYEELRKKGIRPEDYIQFYSIRQHHKMANGEPVTEMIYIHSKILVADDDILVIGSANINDRSLEGSRDSEIAMHFDDSKKVVSHMNGVEVHVSEFVHTFRKRLLSEHLGLSEDEVADPLSDDFIKMMNSRAQTNTEIYREVFACYPDNNMKTLQEVEELRKKKNLDRYDELAPQIKGHVVIYPLDFLCNEELLPSKSSVVHLVGDDTFT